MLDFEIIKMLKEGLGDKYDPKLEQQYIDYYKRLEEELDAELVNNPEIPKDANIITVLDKLNREVGKVFFLHDEEQGGSRFPL